MAKSAIFVELANGNRVLRNTDPNRIFLPTAPAKSGLVAQFAGMSTAYKIGIGVAVVAIVLFAATR